MRTLERGFKSWAERTALAVRRDLGLSADAPITPKELASYLDVTLWTPSNVPDLPVDVLKQLLETDPYGWSAVSQQIDGRVIVIYNPMHSSGRQASDIVHELAHLLLDHEPATVILSPDGIMAMRSFNAKQEEEANWLAWCLLLPREALLRARLAGSTERQIADEYGVTEVLVRFRTRICGVEAQVHARSRIGRPVRQRKTS
jgi:Zn-dependent peptidase ImmA (M78 family)